MKTTQQVAPASATEIPYKMAQPRSKSMMWKLVRYAVDGENVVGVGAFTDHAAMFFYRGRELDEEKKVLQGTGKDTRYLTLRAPADAASPEVKRLLRKAFQLGGAA
jgi:ABC-type proline/glycine betaine transport system substrate-binding protein